MASGVATFIRCVGWTGGGSGMSSPSRSRARARAVAPNFRTPSVDSAHIGPFTSVGMMNTRAASANGRLARA